MALRFAGASAPDPRSRRLNSFRTLMETAMRYFHVLQGLRRWHGRYQRRLSYWLRCSNQRGQYQRGAHKARSGGGPRNSGTTRDPDPHHRRVSKESRRAMIRRFARDESGMAMAVAIFMVLLIGVMGAGLLTFVMSDTKSVLEVNKGQKAMDIAEAGVQAAKAHLRVDSFRQHYDTVTTVANDCAEGPRVGGDNWSKATTVWTATDGACSGGPIIRS